MSDQMPNYVVTPPQASPYPQTEVEFLNAIMQNTGGVPGSSGSGGPSLVNVNGFLIPQFDHIDFTYYGSTNNIQTQVFKTGGAGGTVVATLDYAYAAGAVANDDLITVIQKS